MADGRPPAPPAPHTSPIISPAPPMQLSVSPTQLVGPSAQPISPSTQQIQPAHMPQLNWSHFKPEFTRKPNEDAEAHLLKVY